MRIPYKRELCAHALRTFRLVGYDHLFCNNDPYNSLQEAPVRLLEASAEQGISIASSALFPHTMSPMGSSSKNKPAGLRLQSVKGPIPDENKLNFCLCPGTLISLVPTKELPMNEIIFLVEEAPEGGYTARALGESIFTDADSLDELHANVRDAVRCHFDEGKSPKILRLHGNVPLLP